MIIMIIIFFFFLIYLLLLFFFFIIIMIIITLFSVAELVFKFPKKLNFVALNSLHRHRLNRPRPQQRRHPLRLSIPSAYPHTISLFFISIFSSHPVFFFPFTCCILLMIFGLVFS
jgi:hypothetical protein